VGRQYSLLSLDLPWVGRQYSLPSLDLPWVGRQYSLPSLDLPSAAGLLEGKAGLTALH